MSFGRFVTISLLLTAPGLAGPQLTTIQDVLYNADGTKMNGTAIVTWTVYGSSGAGPQAVTLQIVNGSIYAQLTPNTTTIPPQPYTVTYSVNGYGPYQETWMVPLSTTPLHVRDVRTSSSNVVTGGPAGAGSGGGQFGGGGPLTSTAISESGVTGLVNDLALRPVKGTAYGTGRVAVVDQNGAVDTVVGNFSDCVYVNGTSGPCFDPTQLPGYSDSEIPSGVVDGANANFGLAGSPTPPSSLILFRNGIVQKQGFDYTLTGSVVQYATASAPQPGDTLMAWYRLPPSASNPQLIGQPLPDGSFNGVIIYPTLNAQVICSANGTSITSTTLTNLGTCTIPANFLVPGDRVEIRFLFSHGGNTGAFTYLAKWGSTSILQRTGGINDAVVSGRADASITSSATLIASENYGTVLVLLPGIVSAPDSVASPVTIAFQASGASDPVSLVSYTVIRYPAVGHP
jgi:hypothetical protein